MKPQSCFYFGPSVQPGQKKSVKRRSHGGWSCTPSSVVSSAFTRVNKRASTAYPSPVARVHRPQSSLGSCNLYLSISAATFRLFTSSIVAAIVLDFCVLTVGRILFCSYRHRWLHVRARVGILPWNSSGDEIFGCDLRRWMGSCSPRGCSDGFTL
jgi:hypothetical protein